MSAVVSLMMWPKNFLDRVGSQVTFHELIGTPQVMPAVPLTLVIAIANLPASMTPVPSPAFIMSAAVDHRLRERNGLITLIGETAFVPTWATTSRWAIARPMSPYFWACRDRE